MIVFAGKPGSGKGTQAKILETELGYVSLSVGAILRQAGENNPTIKKTIDAGEIIPNHIIFPILEDLLEKHDLKTLILDGFPRQVDQAQWLRDYLSTRPEIDLVVIELHITDQESRQRLALRGRKDDDPHVVDSRLKKYQNEVLPALELLRPCGVYLQVSGMGSTEVIAERLKQALQEKAGI
ncbi:nucleoside monophosphate kinase [Candidatus Saccharibacteria bacterium]|nr:nucleoside monophosphate kinase [Candidatus Saccharibacteria bacterium]